MGEGKRRDRKSKKVLSHYHNSLIKSVSLVFHSCKFEAVWMEQVGLVFQFSHNHPYFKLWFLREVATQSASRMICQLMDPFIP